MASVESIAGNIVTKFVLRGNTGHCQLERDIAAALTAYGESVRAKFAAFADEKGEPRKVLGTLPVTADGCIIGDKAMLFHQESSTPDEFRPCWIDPRTGEWNEASVNVTWYSTKQAAEAAKGGEEVSAPWTGQTMFKTPLLGVSGNDGSVIIRSIGDREDEEDSQVLSVAASDVPSLIAWLQQVQREVNP